MPQQRPIRRRLAHGRRLVLVGCAMLLVPVSLSACSEESPEPAPLDRASSSPSSTPTPTAEPSGAPTLPPEARGTSDKAAVAFVEHVIEVLNYTARTLDTRPLAKLSSPDCAACKSVIAGTRDIRTAGGRISGGMWAVVETQLLSGASASFRQVQVVVDFQRQSVRRRAGGRLIHHAAGRTVYVFDVNNNTGDWRISAMRGVES